MAKEIKTEISIKASPEKVWEVLTDFESYPKWNPFIKSIAGNKAVGQTLATEIQPPNRKPMKFTPKVLAFTANKELRWLGSGPIKGLFDGEHYFIITANENNTVTFIHGEIFSGILIPLMPKVLKDTELGFKLMNEALKGVCEG